MGITFSNQFQGILSGGIWSNPRILFFIFKLKISFSSFFYWIFSLECCENSDFKELNHNLGLPGNSYRIPRLFSREFPDPRDLVDAKLPSGSSAGNAEGGKSRNFGKEFFPLAFPALQAEQGAGEKEGILCVGKQRDILWDKQTTPRDFPRGIQWDFIQGMGSRRRRIPTESGGGVNLGKTKGKSLKFLWKTNKEQFTTNSKFLVKNKQGKNSNS